MIDNIKFYNEKEGYIEKTFQVSLKRSYDLVKPFLKDKMRILDLGCGSGRDSLYFSNLGHQVDSVDASKKMVDHCKKVLQGPVYHETFDSFQTFNKYDLIWAYASLLHVEREQMAEVLTKYAGYLNENGLFYITYKYYHEDFEIGNRHFTSYTEETFKEVINKVDGLILVESHVLDSAQMHEGQWLILILRRARCG